MDHQSVLRNLRPSKNFFIGIDSDGCVFDTMEVKQKEFFIPNAIKYFDLFAVAGPLRETWEFVNLYSIHRGVNRFPSLVRVFEFLEKRKDVAARGAKIPDLTALRNWIGKENKMSNDTLRKHFESNFDPEIEKVLRWSEAVNREIAQGLNDIYLFPHAEKSIRLASDQADTIVVSQTPLEALEREWEEHGLKKYVNMIAGQEHGTKAEHLALAAKGKYPNENILLIGDAFGDMNAANETGVLFYPIVPGKEDLSWERFLNEGFEKFISGKFPGSYQKKLIDEFRNSLPSSPPWE